MREHRYPVGQRVLSVGVIGPKNWLESMWVARHYGHCKNGEPRYVMSVYEDLSPTYRLITAREGQIRLFKPGEIPPEETTDAHAN